MATKRKQTVNTTNIKRFLTSARDLATKEGMDKDTALDEAFRRMQKK